MSIWGNSIYLSTDKTGSTWEWYKRILNDGKASALCPVGSQLVDRWDKDANTFYDVPWDIVHYDSNGNAYIKWHYANPDTISFDEPEALYYFDGTEQAGVEYYILINISYGTGWIANTGIGFILNSAPEEGDQFVLNTNKDNKNDPTNMTWSVYSAGKTTVKQTGTTINSTAGIKLGETSTTGIGYTNGRVNSPQRVVYGYNRWSQSCIRQYYNSHNEAGAWWSIKNPWDRPPAIAFTLQGFMAGLSDELLSIVSLSDVTTALNTVEGNSSTTETTQDYFFLPSLEQMYINPQLSGTEGESWDYYKTLAQETGLPGKFQTGQTYTCLITNNITDKNTPVNVRLRSASRGYAYNTWYIYSSGYVGSYYAYYAYRGCPACKILKSN